jgi:penicillin-binding protein 2
MDERRRDHSLYIAFAPAEDTKIALAIIVENAGFGSASAAPIARRAFDYWLLGQYPNAQDLELVRNGQAGAPVGKPLVAAEVAWPIAPASAASAPASAASETPPPTTVADTGTAGVQATQAANPAASAPAGATSNPNRR